MLELLVQKIVEIIMGKWLSRLDNKMRRVKIFLKGHISNYY